MEHILHVEACLDVICLCRIYLGCLDTSLYAEREEFLECKHSPKLLLMLEKDS
jgi:hypothetical protein